MVELLDDALGDLSGGDIEIVLHGNIHLRPGGLDVPRQARTTVQRLPKGVQSRDCNIERSLLLGLLNDLIDTGA